MIDKLNKKFIKDQVLLSSELNSIVQKLNEIITAHNNGSILLRLSPANEFQISYDNGLNWNTISDPIQTQLKIDVYADSLNDLKSKLSNPNIGTMANVKDSTFTEKNPVYRLYVYTSEGWVDNGIFNVKSINVILDFNTDPDSVISAKAITEELNNHFIINCGDSNSEISYL